MPLLSVVVPAFNEAATIAQVIRRVEAAQLPDGFEREIIIVNDGSTDGTAQALEPFETRHKVLHTSNSGKGGACRRGFALCRGEFIIVQDADLEQNPNDFPELLQPLLNGNADVVFGSRFMGTYNASSATMRVHYYINRLFTMASNLATGFHTTDVWTGYKMYSRKALNKLLPHLRSDGIEFELEVAVLLGKFGMKVCDVPISYVPRWYSEGKKTDWKQGARSLRKLMEFRLRRVPQ